MMMEHRSLDPYEQQLLKVFDSYDYDNLGSLDRDGLTQLCQTLQLEEQGNELIKCLLNEPKHSRVTFVEFKDALLVLLGKLQNGQENNKIDGSPEREVSPKFVFGSKKYGRRSRPRNEEISPVKERNDVKNLNNSVQTINSQGDVLSKKRKTNGSLSKCNSFNGDNSNDDTFLTVSNLSDPQDIVYTEDMLREVWKKLGVGEDGYLNQTELILVCDAIGLRELANGVLRQLSDKIIHDFNHRISFDELLDVLQRDEAWVDVLNSSSKSDPLNITCLTNDTLLINTKNVQYITLGPKGNGYINVDVLIEMWESAGITSPKLLLNDLGFTSNDIDIVELASVLEKDIKGIQETRSDYSNPHITLLQAILTLYQSEIKCLKSILEQMQAEREKLKNDVAEANNRVTLLAQEVDDNHAKMEKSTMKQVRHLEQRHSEIIRQLTEQCSSDKDQLTALNRDLEDRIAHLEAEESKLRDDLSLAQKYLNTVEGENQNLTAQIVELEQARQHLNEQVRSLEDERLKCHESEQIRIEGLLEQIANLQLENTHLRDRNDEMQSEIENLMRARAFNFDNSMENEPVGAAAHGAKRRSDESPSKELGNVLGLGDASPRLGKVRRFHKTNVSPDVPFASSESGFETELDCLDSSLSNASNENDELVIARLNARIELLERILAENSIPPPKECPSQTETDSALLKVRRLTSGNVEFERVLADLQDDLNRLCAKYDGDEEVRLVNEKFERLTSTTTTGAETAIIENGPAPTNGNVRTNDAASETEPDDLKEEFKKLVDENNQLKSKCDDLTHCLQQLETEYENCEKYWENTLEDERRVFDQEQTQYNEHLVQLTEKIAEYEQEFVDRSNRLPPIEEKSKLEEQFTDLEQEFDDYKEQTEFQLDEKDREIADLKEKLDELKIPPRGESSTQTDHDEGKLNNLTNHVVESTNLFSADTMPYRLSVQNSEHNSLEMPQLAIPGPLTWTRPDTGDAASSSLPVDVSFADDTEVVRSQSVSLFDLPSTSNDQTERTAPIRPKRTRKHERNATNQRIYKRNGEVQNVSCKKINDEAGCGDKVVVTLATMQNMNGRIYHLEQRCRQLQLFIKQQHFHAEQVLQQCWQQHRDEKLHLQFLLRSTQERLDRQIRLCNEQLERLAKNDLLVKDIYVENAFLVANVQRLEQKCHLLSQCSTTNSV